MWATTHHCDLPIFNFRPNPLLESAYHQQTIPKTCLAVPQPSSSRIARPILDFSPYCVFSKHICVAGLAVVTGSTSRAGRLREAEIETFLPSQLEGGEAGTQHLPSGLFSRHIPWTWDCSKLGSWTRAEKLHVRRSVLIRWRKYAVLTFAHLWALHEQAPEIPCNSLMLTFLFNHLVYLWVSRRCLFGSYTELTLLFKAEFVCYDGMLSC